MKKIIPTSILFLLFFLNSQVFSQESLIVKREQHRLFLEENSKSSSVLFKDDFHFDQLELVYVQSGKSYYQWFGHVFLRLVKTQNKPSSTDITIGFIADFNDDKLNPIKAYYGGYDVLPIVKTFEQVLKDYVQIEQRYFDRYLLRTTDLQRKKLIKIVKSWVSNPELAKTYSFRRNGCTALLIKALAFSEIDVINPKEILFPVEVSGYLEKMSLIKKKFSRINPTKITKEEEK